MGKGERRKGLQINMKAKIMVIGCDTGSVRIRGRWSCSVCKKGVVATLFSVFL